jgi:hypothetical protein
MIPMRTSAAEAPNSLLRIDSSAAPSGPPKASRARRAAGRPETNGTWLRSVRKESGLGTPGDVLLVGGASLIDFRVRVAQAHGRHDLTPSYWSLSGIVAADDELVTVTLGPGLDPAVVPATNAIVSVPLEVFDDGALYPNIAVVRFPQPALPIVDAIERLRTSRSIADLPDLVLHWLGFAWGVGGSGNPLLAGLGVPSAAFVETVFSLVDVELTPGLGSGSSCPEAIWQSVKWWHDFYGQAVAGRSADEPASPETAPSGRALVRQREATYLPPVVSK